MPALPPATAPLPCISYENGPHRSHHPSGRGRPRGAVAAIRRRAPSLQGRRRPLREQHGADAPHSDSLPAFWLHAAAEQRPPLSGGAGMTGTAILLQHTRQTDRQQRWRQSKQPAPPPTPPPGRESRDEAKMSGRSGHRPGQVEQRTEYRSAEPSKLLPNQPPSPSPSHKKQNTEGWQSQQRAEPTD